MELHYQDLKRLQYTIADFYFRVLSYVDERCSPEPKLTESCGIAFAIHQVTGVITLSNGEDDGLELVRALGLSVSSVQRLITEFGSHVESSHDMYTPLFREAVRTPAIRALADQLLAAERQFTDSSILNQFTKFDI